ncbi:Cellulose synthase-like protein G2 [Striga hermonthica]|uniref:Cellulose synthase-like protein G2 n=1 Tax=Striga hermonthica TaxID=68872 RepID=A0A9N7NEM4_STRHE|nr:Cellulose synthase-like protein G2 [Striga hermonthica]
MGEFQQELLSLPTPSSELMYELEGWSAEGFGKGAGTMVRDEDKAFRWRLVTRTVYPERLPANDDEFPNIDVFICTADPSKEPSLGVMNTVISAMALDYPPGKLSVYVSDDGGSSVTLEAMREAWRFCKWWLPFCTKYEVKNRCPEAYFSGAESDGVGFVDEKMEIKKKYDEFKEILEKNSANASSSVSRDHVPVIEVMNDVDGEQEMPLLVYVAREKRPSQPHNFKAGAVNTLIRVSALISNGGYILLLDCDHYCNDPTSARQAMCFFLDPKVSPKLAWVQFPQKFHNISDHDIYDCRLLYYLRRWLGIDGIEGPFISGCNMYLKREAVYGTKNMKDDFNVNDMKISFGPSNELIKSISAYKNYKPAPSKDRKKISGALEKEVQLVASCTYDSHSEWGKEVGFIYNSVVEDVITSEYLHCQGWFSVFVDPGRPCFLGSCPTSLNDVLVQKGRWALGQMQISLSKYCALTYGRGKMSALQCMCYAAATFDPIYVFPFYTLSILPQICLLHGISLYPKVSDPYFVVFVLVFLGSQLKHIEEVMFYGDSIWRALYELRMWMMKSSTCYLYAVVGAVFDNLGLHNAHFTLTNKVVDHESETRFKKGIYDFQGSPMVIAPICSLYILNLVSLAFGAVRIARGQEASEVFAQALISLFGVIVNYHVFEGMLLRKDNGRVSPSLSLLCVVIAMFMLCFGSLILVF